MENALMKNLSELEMSFFYIKDLKDKPYLTDLKDTYGLLGLIDWNKLCSFYHLSEDFIDQYKDWVDWSCICCYQELSEEFIELHSDQVDWMCIAQSQKLSEDFIEKHKESLENRDLLLNCNISDEYKLKIIDDVDLSNYTSAQILFTVDEMLRNVEKPELFDKYIEIFKKKAKNSKTTGFEKYYVE